MGSTTTKQNQPGSKPPPKKRNRCACGRFLKLSMGRIRCDKCQTEYESTLEQGEFFNATDRTVPG